MRIFRVTAFRSLGAVGCRREMFTGCIQSLWIFKTFTFITSVVYLLLQVLFTVNITQSLKTLFICINHVQKLTRRWSTDETGVRCVVSFVLWTYRKVWLKKEDWWTVSTTYRKQLVQTRNVVAKMSFLEVDWSYSEITVELLQVKGGFMCFLVGVFFLKHQKLLSIYKKGLCIWRSAKLIQGHWNKSQSWLPQFSQLSLEPSRLTTSWWAR